MITQNTAKLISAELPKETDTNCSSSNANATWQQRLADSITTLDELQQNLQLSKNRSIEASAQTFDFPLRVPRSFAARMQKNNPHDPLLLQVLPTKAELHTAPGYSHDPVGDLNANPLPGLLHKYHGRVLLSVAPDCAIHCRYCFRREFPYATNNPGRKGWQPVIDYIANDTSITEVIYSGGDPLLLPDPILAELTSNITAITHVKRLRIHTRLPIVIPERITDAFVQWFHNQRLQPILVLHCNHAQELDNSVANALQPLRELGITLLNQTVLLKNVNDDIESLANLSERLFELGIIPYYLHMLDKVNGTQHFEVELEQALQLHQQLLQRLPGYLVPKLVREIAGEQSKTLVFAKLA